MPLLSTFAKSDFNYLKKKKIKVVNTSFSDPRYII